MEVPSGQSIWHALEPTLLRSATVVPPPTKDLRRWPRSSSKRAPCRFKERLRLPRWGPAGPLWAPARAMCRRCCRSLARCLSSCRRRCQAVSARRPRAALQGAHRFARGTLRFRHPGAGRLTELSRFDRSSSCMSFTVWPSTRARH